MRSPVSATPWGLGVALHLRSGAVTGGAPTQAWHAQRDHSASLPKAGLACAYSPSIVNSGTSFYSQGPSFGRQITYMWSRLVRWPQKAGIRVGGGENRLGSRRLPTAPPPSLLELLCSWACLQGASRARRALQAAQKETAHWRCRPWGSQTRSPRVLNGELAPGATGSSPKKAWGPRLEGPLLLMLLRPNLPGWRCPRGCTGRSPRLNLLRTLSGEHNGDVVN